MFIRSATDYTLIQYWDSVCAGLNEKCVSQAPDFIAKIWLPVNFGLSFYTYIRPSFILKLRNQFSMSSLKVYEAFRIADYFRICARYFETKTIIVKSLNSINPTKWKSSLSANVKHWIQVSKWAIFEKVCSTESNFLLKILHQIQQRIMRTWLCELKNQKTSETFLENFVSKASSSTTTGLIN